MYPWYKYESTHLHSSIYYKFNYFKILKNIFIIIFKIKGTSLSIIKNGSRWREWGRGGGQRRVARVKGNATVKTRTTSKKETSLYYYYYANSWNELNDATYFSVPTSSSLFSAAQKHSYFFSLYPVSLKKFYRLISDVNIYNYKHTPNIILIYCLFWRTCPPQKSEFFDHHVFLTTMCLCEKKRIYNNNQKIHNQKTYTVLQTLILLINRRIHLNHVSKFIYI